MSSWTADSTFYFFYSERFNISSGVKSISTPVTLRKGEQFGQFCSATSVEVEVLSIESNMILEIPKRKFSCEEADDTVRSLFKDLSGVMSSELIFWMFSC